MRVMDDGRGYWQNRGFPQLRYMGVVGDYLVSVTKGHPAMASLLSVHDKDKGTLLLETVVQSAHDCSDNFFPADCGLIEVSVLSEVVAFFYIDRQATTM